MKKFEQQELLDLAIKYYQMHNRGMNRLREMELGANDGPSPLNEVTTGIALFHVMKHSYIYHRFDLDVWDSTFDPIVSVTSSDIISSYMYFPR